MLNDTAYRMLIYFEVGLILKNQVESFFLLYVQGKKGDNFPPFDLKFNRHL